MQSCAAARTAAQIRRQGSWLNPCRGIQASNWAAANAAAYVMPRRNSLWSSMCATAQSVGSSLLRRSESHLQWQEVLTGCCRARHATGRARPHRGMCSNVRSVLIAARVCGIGAAGIPTRSTSRGAVWTSPSTLATLFTSGFPANSREWLFHRERFRLLTNRTMSPDHAPRSARPLRSGVGFRLAHETNPAPVHALLWPTHRVRCGAGPHDSRRKQPRAIGPHPP